MICTGGHVNINIQKQVNLTSGFNFQGVYMCEINTLKLEH